MVLPVPVYMAAVRPANMQVVGPETSRGQLFVPKSLQGWQTGAATSEAIFEMRQRRHGGAVRGFRDGRSASAR